MDRKIARIEAKRLYIEERKSLEDVAVALNIPAKTIYRWKADDAAAGCDWDKEREAIALTSISSQRQMLQTATMALQNVMEQIRASGKINATDVYAVRQLLLSAKALEKEADNLGNILLAIQEFTEFLAERNPELIEKLHPYLNEFGTYASKKYGKK